MRRQRRGGKRHRLILRRLQSLTKESGLTRSIPRTSSMARKESLMSYLAIYPIVSRPTWSSIGRPWLSLGPSHKIPPRLGRRYIATHAFFLKVASIVAFFIMWMKIKKRKECTIYKLMPGRESIQSTSSLKKSRNLKFRGNSSKNSQFSRIGSSQTTKSFFETTLTTVKSQKS